MRNQPNLELFLENRPVKQKLKIVVVVVVVCSNSSSSRSNISNALTATALTFSNHHNTV